MRTDSLFLDHKPATKPTLRGVSHQIAAGVSLVAGVALALQQDNVRDTLAMAVYAASLTFLFAVSATYHRPNWQPAPRRWMRRLDHAGIYVLVAGTYTPICVVAMPEDSGQRLLWLVWSGAALGIVQSMFWAHAPRALSAALYVLLGWAVVSEWADVSASIGPTGVALLLSGGALYSVGAVVYARKSPSPWPLVFGYHEVFHALVIGAAACHFAVIAGL